MQPKQDRVLVKLDDIEDTTKGGIYLPFETQYKKTRGTVISVGPKVREVAPGDKIMMSQFAGTELDLDDGEYLLVEEQHILGVLED